jgi:4-hydroxy-3-methylbut-2-enyl diphosphate reductase
MLDVRITRFSGFCPGVKRALKIAGDVLAEKGRGGTCFTVGPIIHNPQVVEELKKSGLDVLPEDPERWSGFDLRGKTVIIRSHGMGPTRRNVLEELGARVVDATCPIVKKAQQAALSLKEQGFHVFIVGNPDHPEVRAIVDCLGGEATVSPGPEEVERLLEEGWEPPPKMGLIAQTTIDAAAFEETEALLASRTERLRKVNTLCKTTQKRQKEAMKLSGKADLMLVIGGKNSSNTNHLRKICEEAGVPTRHIETWEELDPSWFKGVSLVGVVGGASTPEKTIDKVIETIRSFSL